MAAVWRAVTGMAMGALRGMGVGAAGLAQAMGNKACRGRRGSQAAAFVT